MKTFKITFLLFIICNSILNAQIPYHEPRAIVDEDMSKPISCTNNSTSYINKYHDLYNEDLSFWKPTANSTIKTIKVNFIVVQKDDGTGNFSQNGVCPINPDKTDEEFLNEMIDKVNDIYYTYLDNPSDTGGKSICGTCNDIQDARIKFELQGIHYYQNSSVYGTSNPYYKVNPESEINIHLNGLNLNYSWANLASFYLSTNHYVFFNRVYQDYCTYGYNAALSLAHLLAHEFGHNLGLCHTYHGGGCPTSNSGMYNSGYYFDDLFGDYPSIFCPDRGGVWNSNPWEDPGDYITNNLMGFTVTRNYLSPKQIAVMQRNLSLKSIRKYVKEDVVDENPIYITQDEIWDFNIKTYSNIIITEGNCLTLSCKVELPIDSKIIIEPGAKLVIDGAEVRSASKNGLWQGIEVHGNSYAHQDETYQGKVELKNGAIIENAVTGVRAGAINTSFKNGGIVWASDATFKNCVNGIVFHPYRNYNPSNPQETSKNKSFINQCNFQTTGHLANLGKQPQLFVMLDDVDMIYIKGNTFVNSNPSDYAITGRGKGIYANNASFTATYICSSQVQPCPEEDRLPNHFEGLTYGIMAENDAGYGNVQINENTFTNNLYGIRLHNLTNPVATLNNITVLPTYEGAMNAMGIFLQTCNQYQVEENYINCQDAGTSTIGVNVVSTGFDPNEIYKNTFENLGYGVYAARTNIGLQLLCNEFNNNHQQIYVEEEGSIASHQGNPEEADAGNIFTPDCSEGSSFREIYNLGPDFFYYHLNEELKEPLCVNNEVALRLIEMDNNCPSNLGGGGSGQVTEITEIDQKATEEQQAKADLQSIIDGGNTQQLNTTVQSSPPSAALQLRNQLLGESPYLSETVMSTTATSEQSLPPVMVRDVLVANPLAGRSENVDSALDSRQNPLPWYLLAQIKAAGQNMSARDLMEAHISKLGKEKEEMIKNNIKSYLTDTNGVKADSVIYLYSNYPTLDKAYSLVHFHLQNGNTTQARNVYQGISSQFQLSSTQQDEYNRTGTLLTMAETIYANDSTWHSIDSSQLSVISNIALDISDRAGLWARSILALHEQAEYDFPVIIADSSKSSNTNPKPVVHSYSFNVYPDPANDYFAVEYCIEDRKYKEARLEITAIDGKNMESMSLEHPADQLLFKTKSYKPGIYLCKLRLDNSTEGMKRFTITKGEEGAAILSTIEGGTGKTPVMMVYPNPSGGNFTVEYTTGSKQCNNCKLQIVSLEGKIMKEIAIDKPAGRRQVDAGDMENGIYYMIFYNNDNPVFREKIIIQ